MYVIGSAARCGCKAVGYSYMWYPGTTCAARRGEGIYTTSLLVPHWWCLVCTSSVTHSHSDTVDCTYIHVEASRIKSISGEIKGRYTYVFKPCTTGTPKIGHKCPSWRVVVCTVHVVSTTYILVTS